MRTFLAVTAVLEGGAGAAFLCFPSAVVAFLLGSPLDTGAAVALGRVVGVALLALGVACWLVRHDALGRAARGMVAAMLLYNCGAGVILGVAGIRLRPVGVALWPAVIFHVVMAAWCVSLLRRKVFPPGKE